MSGKKAAKDEELTKTAEGKEKEFASPDMAIEGVKDAAKETKTAPVAGKPLTIGDLLPGLRKKGMKI